MPDVFRRAGEADLDAIASLYLSCARAGRVNGTSDWDDDYPNREFAEEDLRQDGLYVLERDGEIISAVSMLEHDDLDELPLPWTDVPSCALMRLCVRPELQGQGIGAEMTALITEEAKAQGYGATRHLSSMRNSVSTQMYRRLGYREVGSAHLYDTDFACFERVLK